jgi:hypothetical protein
MPLESLSSAGFAKWMCQNLEPKGFRYQNLDRKRFTGFPMLFAPTASALTMMTGLREEGKVGCHNEGVDSGRGCAGSRFRRAVVKG